jgi:hypothetical protein
MTNKQTLGVDNCLTLITLQPSFKNTSRSSSAEVFNGSCCMMGFGIGGAVWEAIALSVRADG